MEDYRQYLAQKILTEDQVVTYRLLSRALKVHVNTAKEMLYEFHKWQNDKRPGTLHATYLVYGTKLKVEQQDGDVEMTDSQTSEDVHVPFSDEVPTHTLSLVKEGELQEALALYVEVTSIHVYSLAPHPLKDLQLLADTARQVLELSSGEDAKVFGAIANPNVRKRERRAGSKPAASASAPKAEPKPPIKKEVKPTPTPDVKEETKAATPKGPREMSASASAPAKKPANAATLKRQGSSNIGQMFAKAAANPKPKKPAAKVPVSKSAATSTPASGAEDTAMSDDGEDDAEPVADVKQEESGVRQARKNRQAELQRMMEESDDDEPEKADSLAEESMEDEPPAPEPETKTEEPAEVVSSASGGRRRGRRRVTRKKQILDEQGYLVTIQEPGWESFSEDEAPPPPKPKAQPVKTEPAAKPKKGAAKGQGNIMSFFSKK
ncbi:Uu.00g053390.m01.CDS01 [Anthostomella pinea]|uniref:DNA polymerase delta subunit 3 n=1 Tax=Anthostomella pinea TaxID=933095 RepID=A0AAI8VWF0_9PEZI|nr:Uu.00g053390.m01.CDS01 [Anthostomella pinea]